MEPASESRKIVLRALIIILPVALVLGVISAYVYTSEVNRDRTELFNHEMQLLIQQKNEIIHTFDNIASDLLNLSENHELRHILTRSPEEHMDDIEYDFLQLSRIKGIYDQIRYIDSDGMEVVRVNYNNGSPSVVPKSKLQDKRGRYYFIDSMKLDKGDIYISPLDLNIEHGQIEVPYKPMVRFGTPVYDDNGNKRGVIVLNFMAGGMLQSMKDSLSYGNGTPMLLNKDGYWFMSPDVRDEWGFMLKNNKTFQGRYPDAWAEISSSESGHAITPDGLFSFITIPPLKEPWISSTGAVEPYTPSRHPIDFKDYWWKAVLHIPQEQFTAYSGRLATTTLALYLLSMLIVTVLSWRNAIIFQKRRIAEKKIIESRKSLQKSQEIAKLGNWDWDLENNTLYWSDEIYRIFGLVPQAFAATYEGFINTVHPDDRGLVSDAVENALKEKHSFNIDHRIVLPNGEIKMVQEQGSVTLDDSGKPSRITGTVQDITERKKAEEAIAQNEMFIRSILNSTEEPIMVINADYQILMMNDHARRNAKRFTDESAPVYCYKVSHHRDSPCSGEDHKCPLTEVIESGKPFSEFHIHKDEKGEERYVEVLASPITGEGGDVHAIVETCRDITKHIHTEKDLRQALVDRDTLIREIHHRVKNNLAVIQSLLSLQASHSPDESTKGILDESKNRVTAMSMIHERLYQSSDMSKVDFKEYIESLATLLFNNYRTQGLSIALRTDIPSLEIDIDTMIPCGLIVNELLSNALKYAFEPGDIAEIYIGVELDGKGRMHLVVRDNGKGLPDGFDIDQTTTLGMKLVSSLSRQIGSDVQILCEGGTEFRVLLLRHTLPPLIWDDNKYLTHNREIDMQHRKLLEAISSLKDAILSGRNEEGLQQIIPKLLEYVELHFKTEEDHMRALGYPKQDEHIAAHRDFTSKVNSVIADIKRGKTGLSLSVYDFLATWLKKHVAGIDMDLGEFLAEKGMTDTDAPV